MRCVVCLRGLSMKRETAGLRYFDKELHGWAHTGCDPDRPKSPEELLLEEIFGNRVNHHRSREDVSTADLAADHGHVVTKERQPTTPGSRSTLKRVVCSCGFETPWSIQEKAATEAKRAHLKEAAIYG